MSTQPGKDTIYIDVDDEITAIIDKVRGSHEKIVALVLPKRATVLQSIVNMKLLKRTADAAKKHLVLITSEASLLPLAGSVGMYAAKTLQSKPEIPANTSAHGEAEEQEEAVNMGDDIDGAAPVGEHMRRAPASVVHPTGAGDDDQPIELDNTAAAAGPAASHGGADAAKKAKKKGGKKFTIPDFNKFRVWGLIGGVALVALIFLWYMGFMVMPRASISVKTDSTAIEESLDVRLSTTSKEVDVENPTVPAQQQQTQKTITQQAATTGQKDLGNKASGTVTMTAQECGSVTQAPDVPAGTGLSANGLTFITQEATSFTVKSIKNNCINFVANGATDIVAQNNGANYNIEGANFTVAGRSDVAASGSTSGGTSNIVKVVAQADIDSVKQKIATQDADAIKRELKQGLTGKGLYAIDGTFANAEPEVITNVKVGDQAETVTVTQKTTYTMMGAKQDDLKKIIDKAVSKKIDKNKQQILDYGLGGAVFKLQSQTATTTLTVMDVTAVAGTDINLEDIKKQVAGKKSNDAKEIIGKYPGVTDVTVGYSPFWVSSIPKKASKIHVTVEKPATTNAN
jgi:hypothetical protein